VDSYEEVIGLFIIQSLIFMYFFDLNDIHSN
jgi:hypothetical protein